MNDHKDILPPRPEGYHDTGEHAYKERTLDTYRSMIFRDATDRWSTHKPENLDDPTTRSVANFMHSLKHYEPKGKDFVKDSNVQYDWDWPEPNIFGGYGGFFSNGASILDLGSGHGQVVQEINQKYGDKDVKCFGVDHRYSHDVPQITTSLVTGDFRGLPFADNSFDRMLAVESFPAWLPKNRDLIQRYFQEIKGAIWRGTLPTYDEYNTPTISDYELTKYFCDNGWELVVNNGIAFIARLVDKYEK